MEEFHKPSAFVVEAVPNSGINPIAIMQAIGEIPFSIIHDFSKRRTSMLFYSSETERKVSIIKKLVPGLSLVRSDYGAAEKSSIRAVCVYATPALQGFMADIFSYINESQLAVYFIPSDGAEINSKKANLAKMLSRIEEKGTSSISGSFFGKQINTSLHTGNYNNREEVEMLRNILDSLESSILNGWPAYKVYLCFNPLDKYIGEYLKSRYAILDEFEISYKDTANILKILKARNSLPLGIQYSKNFLAFPSSAINYVTHSAPPVQSEGIPIGEYMGAGVLRTGLHVRIEPSAFNLGCIVTGMPGTGKTSAVMNILSEISKTPETKVVVISPTKEWRRFSGLSSSNVLSIGESLLGINLFRCPTGSQLEKFYENLAMVISHASAAGPYQKPLEKCLLDAFEKFKNDSNPDPLGVYNSIEESVIRLHGKRTNTGVKYTKHGENINSAVEDLRMILRKPQFRSKSDTDFGSLIEHGAVLDISSAGPIEMPYLYALILNQLYSIVDAMDENGEDRLRLVICLEEAQLIFGDRSKENDAALRDIKNRIQDFRKKGVGMILITHNISEINQSIRSMCQIKAYFKQAPSEAERAASDLVFSLSEKDSLITSLTHLEKRVFALNYISKSGGTIRTPDSIFVRSLDEKMPAVPHDYPAKGVMQTVQLEKVRMRIHVDTESIKQQKPERSNDRISGAVIVDFGIESKCENAGDNLFTADLYRLQRYKLSLRNAKGNEVCCAYIVGVEEAWVRVNASGINVTY